MPAILSYSSYQHMLDKLRSSDADFRCMAIIDFQKEAKQEHYRLEDAAEREMFKEILKLVLDDSVTEVKNMAAQCLATLTRLSEKPGSIVSAVDTLLKNSVNDNEEQRDIATLALKSMLLELRSTSSVVTEVSEKVIQGTCKQLQNSEINTQHAVELLDILSLIFTQYSAQVAAKPALQATSLSVLLGLLASPRMHIRKRAIVALGSLAPTANREVFRTLSDRLIGVLGEGGDSIEIDEEEGVSGTEKQTAYVALVGTLGKAVPSKIGKVLDKLLPGILSLANETGEDVDSSEASMTTLETLVIRCPTEVTPFLTQITNTASNLLKYDPIPSPLYQNYAAAEDDEEDEDMDHEEEDDEDLEDEFDEEYFDDEDVSWKARRSAAKLLQALIGSRIELLNDWYSSVAPLLTSRLSEREESVRIEVFAAWEILLKQTALYANSSYVSAGEAPTGLKRKRLDSNAQAIEGSSGLLTSHTVALTKAVLKQSTSKSVATKEKSFNLLRSVVKLAPGSLTAQSTSVITNIQKSLIGAASAGGSNATSLTLATLSFLAAFVQTHPARSYASSLPQIANFIVKFINDKYQRVSLEALDCTGSLAIALAPVDDTQSSPALPKGYVAPIQQLYEAVCRVLASNNADSEVKDRALYAVGDLLTHEGDVLIDHYDKALPYVSARLNTEANQMAALSVINDIAISSSCSNAAIDQWLESVLQELPTLFRRCAKPNRSKALVVLATLLSRFGQNLPQAAGEDIVTELKSYVTVHDLHNLAAAMHALAQVLRTQPALQATIEREILPTVRDTMLSPSLHAMAIEGIQDFLTAYITTAPESAPGLVSDLINGLLQTSKAIPTTEDGSTQSFANVAKCIGAIFEKSQSGSTKILADCVLAVKKGSTGEDANLYLSLLVLGEIGRTNDVSENSQLLPAILRLFDASSEQIKSAAAFAAGNIAVGNTSAFLPVVVQGVAQAKTPAGRLLYLHALKEAIVHCSNDQIEGIASSLWEPLLSDDGEGQDDGARNVKAACIGKLTSSNPIKYIPDLKARLTSASAVIKATIVASTRYTLTDSNTTCDEILGPAIYDFLALMQDSDHVVRRLAVSSTNAAGQYKPYLIVNQLSSLMPMIYAETQVKPELIREYQMGPFVVKMDDGLNNRKGAFEAMQTLLNTCRAKLNLNELFDMILTGLSDADEIKLLAVMMLQRLSALAEGIVAPRLDELVDRLEAVTKPLVPAKDDTEQDIQRKEDFQKTAVSCIAPLAEINISATSPKFDKFVNDLIKSGKWEKEFAAATSRR